MKTPRDSTAPVHPKTGYFQALFGLVVALAHLGGVAYADPLPGSVPAGETPQMLARVAWVCERTHSPADFGGPPPPRLHINPQANAPTVGSGDYDSPGATATVAVLHDDVSASSAPATDTPPCIFTVFAARVSRTRGQPAQT